MIKGKIEMKGDSMISADGIRVGPGSQLTVEAPSDTGPNYTFIALQSPNLTGMFNKVTVRTQEQGKCVVGQYESYAYNQLIIGFRLDDCEAPDASTSSTKILVKRLGTLVIVQILFYLFC